MAKTTDPGIDVSYRPYRLEITGSLSCPAPLHIGSGERLSLATDAPVLRENSASAGAPYLPGSSLRGVLRAYLKREASLLGCGREVLDRLFGKSPGRGAEDEVSAIGRLAVWDAYLDGGESSTPGEIRDHVAIDSHTGAAKTGAKFDAEVALPENQTFQFRACYEGKEAKDPELVLLGEAIRALEKGELSIGAKSGWGYGRVQLQGVAYQSFDRSKDEDLASYFQHRLGASPSPATSFQWPKPFEAKVAGDLLPYSIVAFDLRLIFEGPVLVKAPIPPLSGGATVCDPAQPGTHNQAGLKEADHVFLTRASDQNYYLPGSSLRGVLRHQAERIGQTICPRNALGKMLFGSAKESEENGKAADRGQKGRIEVLDGELEGTTQPIYLDHVAIDRITAAAEDGKKFATCGLASPRFKTSVTIRFTAREPALLALWGFLLRDLCEGRLWAGSGTSRGYGFIKKAEITGLHCNLVAAEAWQIPEDLGVPITCRPGRLVFSKQAPDGQAIGFAELNWLWEPAQQAWKEFLEKGTKGNQS